MVFFPPNEFITIILKILQLQLPLELATFKNLMNLLPLVGLLMELPLPLENKTNKFTCLLNFKIDIKC